LGEAAFASAGVLASGFGFFLDVGVAGFLVLGPPEEEEEGGAGAGAGVLGLGRVAVPPRVKEAGVWESRLELELAFRPEIEERKCPDAVCEILPFAV
jgi:hypothetical protein